MFYIVYKITNKINGKFYIGTHKTKDLNDDYMGSGKYLKLSQEKYGLDNFTKEVLFIFDNPEDMFAKESEIVTEEFLAEENTYNLKIGGFGGWDYLNNSGLNNSNKTKDQLRRGGLALRNRIETDPIYAAEHGKRSSDNITKSHRERKIRYDTFTGKSHTDATKKLIGEKTAILQRGSGNSQFGTMWITNGLESKKMKKTDPIPEGWCIGRKMKSFAPIAQQD